MKVSSQKNCVIDSIQFYFDSFITWLYPGEYYLFYFWSQRLLDYLI